MVKKALASLKPDPYIFMPVQSGFGSTTLDFLGCIAGKFIAIETKADGTKKLTPRQIATMDFIRLAGGKVFVVYDQTTCDEMLAQLTLMMEFDPDAVSPSYAQRLGALASRAERLVDLASYPAQGKRSPK